MGKLFPNTWRGEGSLREGYHLLADIRQNIQEVKNDLAANPASGQELQSMVEEFGYSDHQGRIQIQPWRLSELIPVGATPVFCACSSGLAVFHGREQSFQGRDHALILDGQTIPEKRNPLLNPPPPHSRQSRPCPRAFGRCRRPTGDSEIASPTGVSIRRQCLGPWPRHTPRSPRRGGSEHPRTRPRASS